MILAEKHPHVLIVSAPWLQLMYPVGVRVTLLLIYGGNVCPLPSAAGEAMQRDARGREGVRQRQQALRQRHPGPVPTVQKGRDDLGESLTSSRRSFRCYSNVHLRHRCCFPGTFLSGASKPDY